ncbi:hypothetical protein Syun_020805 [Stephania yunnanensis]|uniref:Uncharacterized protein n=1 Tax=Stephania yunnanensis TaxID=152371 RepID=A0AAP0NP79_9MAGN
MKPLSNKSCLISLEWHQIGVVLTRKTHLQPTILMSDDGGTNVQVFLLSNAFNSSVIAEHHFGSVRAILTDVGSFRECIKAYGEVTTSAFDLETPVLLLVSIW